MVYAVSSSRLTKRVRREGVHAYCSVTCLATQAHGSRAISSSLKSIFWKSILLLGAPAGCTCQHVCACLTHIQLSKSSSTVCRFGWADGFTSDAIPRGDILDHVWVWPLCLPLTLCSFCYADLSDLLSFPSMWLRTCRSGEQASEAPPLISCTERRAIRF
jgi:hypothetical protein